LRRTATEEDQRRCPNCRSPRITYGVRKRYALIALLLLGTSFPRLIGRGSAPAADPAPNASLESVAPLPGTERTETAGPRDDPRATTRPTVAPASDTTPPAHSDDASLRFVRFDASSQRPTRSGGR